jgi:VanZ family protein
VTAAVRAWGPACLWAALIFALSAQPTLPVSLGDGRDKLAHLTAYAVLGFLLARARGAGRAALWLPILLGLAYAASDEIHQSFVPGRSADPFDWVADAIGVALGVLLFHLGRRTAPAAPTRS